jgi:O-methyltransferase
MMGKITFLKNFKKWGKKIIWKYTRLLGSNFSGFFSHISYLIKTSQHLQDYAHLKTIIDRYALYDTISNKEKLKEDDIIFLEFGVWEGQSYKWWLANNNNPNSQFAGFDTFQGLPEDWTKTHPKGTFSTNGKIPKGINDERSSFKIGLFQETLSPFIRENEHILKKKKLVIHLDADLHSSTIYLLVTLLPYLKKSDILIFDEFYSLKSPHSEFRAFLDFISLSGCEYEGLAKTYAQFALKILCIKNNPVDNKG